MSNLADMVTGALNLGEGEVEEVSEPKTAAEVYQTQATAWDALEAGRAAEVDPTSSPKAFHKNILSVAAKYLSFARTVRRSMYAYEIDRDKINPTFAGEDLLLRAGDYLHNPSARSKKEILAFLHQINDEMEIYQMRDIEGRLEYIRSIWEKDAARVISECCNVTKSTASGWLRGSGPGHSSQQATFLVRIAFHLKSTIGMTDHEVRDWFDSPLDSGRTPIEMIAGEDKIPETVREYLRSNGVVIIDWLYSCPKN